MDTNKLALDFTATGALPPDSTELIEHITSEIESNIKALESNLEKGCAMEKGWRLLAALYLGTNRTNEFNSLKQRYEDKFDTSIFEELYQNDASLKSFRATFEMPQKITCDSLPNVESVCKACISPTGASLNFSKVKGADTHGLRMLTKFLAQLPNDHTKPTTPELDRFIARLEKAAESDESTEDIWNLLFEYQRFSNNTQKFEDLSIKYAIRYGISPPGW